MIIDIWISDKIKPFQRWHITRFPEFLQKMVNRIMMGSLRYDPPNADQGYMNLVEKEWKKYRKTGNCEHLYNVANYCYLESVAPQNKRFHFNENVRSVRRRD